MTYRNPAHRASINYKLVNNEDYICGLYNEGRTQTSIALQFGVTQSAISQLLSRKGVTTRWSKSPRKTTVTTDAAKSAIAVLSKFTPEEIKAAKVFLKAM